MIARIFWFSFLALTIAGPFLVTTDALAALEWRVGKNLPLKAEVQDIAESPDGKRLFVLTNQGDILVFSSAGEVETTISIPFKAKHLDISRNGDKLYLAGEEASGIQEISLIERYQIELGDSPFLGDPAASIAIVVFSDFQWPYCARINPFLDQLVEKYPSQVKLVFKNFPLRNHKMALPAAQAALASHWQGKFWPYHDKVFASFNNLSPDKLHGFAKEIGLDMEQFNRDLKNPKINQLIAEDMQLGQRVGVRGTPTIFINGILLEERSITAATRLIENELQRSED